MTERTDFAARLRQLHAQGMCESMSGGNFLRQHAEAILALIEAAGDVGCIKTVKGNEYTPRKWLELADAIEVHEVGLVLIRHVIGRDAPRCGVCAGCRTRAALEALND